MCSIFGWLGKVTRAEKQYIITNAPERGRDGFGCWADGVEFRSITKPLEQDLVENVLDAYTLVGNFRATPTTEARSVLQLLQPYEGIVHNGTIANDKDFGNFPIDSMVLPIILKERAFGNNLLETLSKIKGSFALAYFDQCNLILAVNYKPIYFILRKDGFMFASTPDILPGFSVPMSPYSTMCIGPEKLTTEGWQLPPVQTLEFDLKQNNKVLVSASSGLDSTTVAFMLKDQGYDVTLIHFKYGCLAESKELDRIKKIADYGHFNLDTIDMPSKVMRGSIVEGTFHDNAIEGVEYAMDWVSARNLLMLAMLTSYAESFNYGFLAFGGNLEESSSYPDNEQEFGRRFNALLPFATQNGVKITLLQPLSTYMKHEIVTIGVGLGVPYDLTWSCYSSAERHCGRCGPCYMRKVAFERNGLKDPVF